MIAVPTVWTLFPLLGQIWVLWRAFVLVAWGAAALLIVISTDRQVRQVDKMMGKLESNRRREQKEAGEVAIGLLLQGSVLRTHDLCLDVYLPTNSGKIRVTYSSRTPLHPVEWMPPRGATGNAFATGQRVYAPGETARDETFLLSPEEQREARNLEVVAAEPMKNAAGRVIGVLSAYGSTNNGWIDALEGRNEHRALAAAIARLLIDLCRLATDDDPQVYF